MNYEYVRKNLFDEWDEETKRAAFEYAESYKAFLGRSKTERTACDTAIELAKKQGYKPYDLGDKVKKGDKLYFCNRGKNLFLIKVGTNDIEKCGIKLMAAHIDSPRIDVRPNPIYEEGNLCFFRTHYYGGIKKYQWTTIALALYGVVVLKGGKKIDVCIGEGENDPVFCITDLLPHLSDAQEKKTIGNVVTGESLNPVVGSMTLKQESAGVKAAVLKLLHDKYGIEERDFQSAELAFVPAAKPRDAGFDRSMICAYGHDDKVCAYPTITALFESKSADTIITVLSDKEETGSDGTTGMQAHVISDVLESVCRSLNADSIKVRYNSMCMSCDVTAAYDPLYGEAYEKSNASYMNCGVSITKYHGSRGKYSTNDASAETVGYVRDVFESGGVVYQSGELGKMDMGGGGTVARYIAKLGIDTCDVSVAILSMHAPLEIASKVDIYEMHRAMLAFCNYSKG